MKYKAGIIGLGKMGRIRAQHILKHPQITLTAISDINKTQTDAPEFTNATYYKEYTKLLEQDLDIIFVCTFNQIAPHIVIEAIRSGKHVFCEKPAGCTVEDVLKIQKVSQSHPKSVVKFGFNHRWHYAIMEAKSMVANKNFGKILWIRGIYGKCGSTDFEKQWRNKKELSGGGILLDQGIHMLDLFRYFLGDFSHVMSSIKSSYWNIDVEDNAFVILENLSGQVATLHSSATQWKHKFSMEICLENGYINIGGLLSSTRSYGEESLAFAYKQLENESHAFGKPREETIYFDKDDSWALELEEFYKAIDQNIPIEHGNIDDMLCVMKLVHSVYQSNNQQIKYAIK